MALTETRPETERREDAAPAPTPPSAVEQLIGSGDHLTIGRLFVGFGLFFLALSSLGLGVHALDRMTADGVFGLTDVLRWTSLVGMVLMGVLPVLLGLAVFVVPRQVGSPSIAFPRAAAAALWTWLIGGALFITSAVLDGGIGGTDTDAARLGSLSMGVMMAALSLGAVCVATTVLSHRPIGMGLARVPLFAWSMLVATPIWILTFGSTVAHVWLGRVGDADAAGLTAGFADGIAWFLRAPSIYMLAIPVLGIIGDAVVFASGRRIAAYGVMQGLIGAFGVASFGVWTQSAGGTENIVWVLFVLVGAVPVLGVIALAGENLRHGKVTVSTGLIAAVLAPLLVLGGVAAGALQALDQAGSGNLWSLDTDMLLWTQAIFLTGAAAVGGVAGLAHWSRRLWNAPAPQGPGIGAAVLLFLGSGALATIHLAQSIAAREGEAGLVREVLFGVMIAGAVLVVLGAVSALAMVLGAGSAGSDSPDPDDDVAMTLEWWPAGPVVSGDVEAEVPVVASPYPLADLRDGPEEDNA